MARSGEGRRVTRLRRLLVAALFVAGAFAAVLSASASAASAPSASRVVRVCGTPRAGAAACAAMKLVPAGDMGAQAKVVKKPYAGFLTPQDLHAAYSLPSGTTVSSTQTIAVIDAYDDPTVEADLAVYDEEFGLPACTSANGCLRKLNQEGRSSPLPTEEGEWAAEISIDVEMAHAVCQNCHVLLVEAENEEFTSLGAAVDAAVNAGATEISNSYAGPEEPIFASVFSEWNADYYEHPGVIVTASSGDCGYLNRACPQRVSAANFPADSPDVVAVGGTTLADQSETWASTVWAEGGSGCSQIFSAPSWQSALASFSATGCREGRSIADVAAIGNPNTGVDIYDSTPEAPGAPTGWAVYGGTSVSSPIIAAEFALAGGSRGVAFPAATLYSHLGEDEALYDVVSGSNGSCAGASSCQAGVGYDGPSGVGSPIGLNAFALAGSPVSASAPAISGVAEEGRTLTATAGAWTGSPTSLGDQWEQCKPSGSGCLPIAGATGETLTLTAGEVGSTIRVQEIAGNAAGFGYTAQSAQSATVVSNVLTLAGFTPSSGITGSTATITGTGLSAVTSVEVGKLAATFKVLSSTQMETIVPDGARAGKVSVSTPTKTVTSKSKFTPTLSVTAFSPASAVPGKLVTIKGIGFNTSSSVSFDGRAASVTFVSSTKLKATVPAGVQAGQIAVTNSSVPTGTVFSARSFAP
jgi:IPT/TIG domain